MEAEQGAAFFMALSGNCAHPVALDDIRGAFSDHNCRRVCIGAVYLGHD